MKPMPTSSMQRAMASGDRWMFSPIASSTSALPLLLDTPRPPCLLTLAPAAAATNIEQVEMLKVCEPSPPVPTMSTRCFVSATWTLVENSRITCAAAVISPMVSFFTRRPVMSAAVITGDSSPLMIRRITCSISSWKISRCSMVRWSASWGVMDMSSPRNLSVGIVGQGQPQAKRNEHGARGAVQPVHAALHAAVAGHPAGGSGPGGVHRDAVDVEEGAEQHEGQRLVLGLRRDELRHERQEEDRDLRVQHVGEEAAAKDAPQVGTLAGRGPRREPRHLGPGLREQQLHPDPHQVR